MLAKKIQTAIKALADKRESLVTAVAKMEETPTDESLVAQVETLSAEIETETKALETLQRAEKALALKAVPVGVGPIILPPKREEGSLDLIVRTAVVIAEAHHTHRTIGDVMATRYPEASDAQKGLMLIVTKAAQNPAMTNVAGYAAELIQQTYSAFLNALAGGSTVPQVPWYNAGSFDQYGSIIIPYRSQRAAAPNNFDAAFRAEGAPVRVGTLHVASLTMLPYSMGVIGTFTKELFKRSTPNIEAVIRQAILEDTAEALEGVVWGAGAAVAGVRPAGLLNGIAGADTHASTGALFDEIHADTQAMIRQLFTVRRLGAAPVWIMNPANKMALAAVTLPLGAQPWAAEVNAGTFKGIPIKTALSHDPAEVLLVDGNAIAFAGGTPTFEATEEASLHEENQTPLPLGTPPMRSLFQTHSAAIKTMWDISWLPVRVGPVQQLTGVAW